MKPNLLASFVLSFLLSAVTAGAQSQRPFTGLFSHTQGTPSGTTVAANFNANPYLAGITIKVGWSTIQPNDAATFNWSGIGDVLTVAGERGKQVHLAIIPGFTTPAWVYAAPHNVPFLNDVTVSGVVGDAPIPWNPTYMALFDALMDSFADYLATHPHKSALKAVEVTGHHYRGEEMHAPSVATFTAQGFTVAYNDVYANWQHWINRWAQKFPAQDMILVISQTYTGTGTDGSNLALLLNDISQYFVDTLHPGRRAILQTDQLDGRKKSASGTTNQRCIVFNSGAYAGGNGVPNGHEMVGNFRTQPYRQGRPAMTVFNFRDMLHPHYMQIWSGNINDLWVSRDLLREWYRYRNHTPAEVQADLATRGLYLPTSSYATGSTAPQADDTLNVNANGTPVVVTLSYDDTAGTTPDSASDFRITLAPAFGTLGAIGFSGGVATVTYTPTSGNVIDTFRWEVTDTTPSDFNNNAQRSNFAIATVEVGTVPHDPLFSLDPIVSAGLNPPVPPANAGAAYTGTLAGRATDADAGTTLTYGKDSGPVWLDVAVDGAISGTPGPSDAGENRWIVSATDNTGRTGFATLVIDVTGTVSSLAITTASPAPGCVAGFFYSFDLAATGGTAPYAWNVSAGSLPAGLSLSSGGVVSGTPASTGAFNFTAQVTDSASASVPKAFAITSSATAPLAILYNSFPAGLVGSSFTQTLHANGGSPPYAWDLASGSLPAGLTLGSDGVVSGTPVSAGAANFTVRVTDSLGAQKTKSYNLQTLTPGTGVEGEWENLADGSQGRTTFNVSAAGEVIPAYVRTGNTNEQRPLVILVHGGGTSESGTYALGRQNARPVPQLIAAGFVIYSMDFSLVAGSALDDGEWELAARAIETARRLPFVDARRVAMIGQSHGGALALGASFYEDILCAVPCAPAAIDPIAAWRFQQAGGTIAPNLQGVINSTAALYGVPMATLAASPSAYGYRDPTYDAPSVRYPLLLVSGLNDTASPPPVMDSLTAKLAAAGKIFETYYPENGPHGFVFSSPNIPETVEFTTRAIAFLNKYFSLADTDADGLPDGWERSRFGHLDYGPDDDPDGDGQKNAAEYRAGTHPLDPASALQIHATTVTPEGWVTLRFPLVPGLGHVVDHTQTLQGWQTITDPVFSQPATGIFEWTDDGTLTGGTASRRFYRVRVP